MNVLPTFSLNVPLTFSTTVCVRVFQPAVKVS